MATKKKTVVKRTAAKKTFAQVRSDVDDLALEDPRQIDFERAQRQGVLAAVKNVTVESAIAAISDTSLKLTKSLAELQQSVIEQTQSLEQLDEAIQIKEEALQTLYDKEVIAEELSAMVARYATEKANLQILLKRMEDDFVETLNEKKKVAEREARDYEYKKSMDRRLADDKFTEDDRRRFAGLQLRQEEFERGWREREAVVASKEQEYIDLRAQVDGFPEKLKNEISKEINVVVSSVKRDLTHQFQLEKQNLDNQLNLAKQSVDNSARALQSQEVEINRLRVQLEAANQKIVDIAKSGFDSVSGQRSLDALQSFSGSQQAQKPGKA